MTQIEIIQAEAEQAQRHAREIAAQIIREKYDPGAGELDALRAETAELIIKNAEQRASLLPADQVRQRDKALQARADALAADVEHEVRAAETEAAREAAIQAGMQRLSEQEEDAMTWLAVHERATWQKARSELLEMVGARYVGH